MQQEANLRTMVGNGALIVLGPKPSPAREVPRDEGTENTASKFATESGGLHKQKRDTTIEIH
jgi:hypothetical protein